MLHNKKNKKGPFTEELGESSVSDTESSEEPNRVDPFIGIFGWLLVFR